MPAVSAVRLLTLLVGLWVTSEVVLGVFKRSKGTEYSRRDSGSSPLLWGTIALAVGLAMFARRLWWAHIPGDFRLLFAVALAIVVFGLALRWWAIVVLGRFFTADLAVQSGQMLVQAGPYKWLRHPSYTGLLLAFLGTGLSMCNWVSLVAVVVPIFAAILYRIHAEEKMLSLQFGEAYARYCKTTKRLLPGVY